MTCAPGLLCAEENVGNLNRNALSGILGLLCVEQNVRNLEISKTALSGILGLLRAGQDVGNLKKCTFRNYGAPLRRSRRRKSQKMHFQELWDSCAQNTTSEISTNALSGIMGLLCAEQDVEHFKNCTSKNSGTPVRRTKRRTSRKRHFQKL